MNKPREKPEFKTEAEEREFWKTTITLTTWAGVRQEAFLSRT